MEYLLTPPSIYDSTGYWGHHNNYVIQRNHAWQVFIGFDKWIHIQYSRGEMWWLSRWCVRLGPEGQEFGCINGNQEIALGVTWQNAGRHKRTGRGAGGGLHQLRKYSGKTLGIRAKAPGIRYILIQIFIFILSPASTTRPKGPRFKLWNGFGADLPLVST